MTYSAALQRFTRANESNIDSSRPG